MVVLVSEGNRVKVGGTVVAVNVPVAVGGIVKVGVKVVVQVGVWDGVWDGVWL